MMTMSPLPRIRFGLLLAACAGALGCSHFPGALGRLNTATSGSSSTAGPSTSVSSGQGGTADKLGMSAPSGAFSDRDEGSTGPLQDAHDGQVVFANRVIERKNADEKILVNTTTLAQPLYLRGFLKHTPARIFHDRGLGCDADHRNIWIIARLEGSKTEATLSERALGDLFVELRSTALTEHKPQGAIVSFVPTTLFTIGDDSAPQLAQFSKLVAEMKPGKNLVEVDVAVGCAAHGAEGRRLLTAAHGTITFDVKAGDLTTFVKRTGPKVREGSLDSTRRLKPLYQKLLVPGAELFEFAASGTAIEPMVAKKTDVRVILRNADKTCTYGTGEWVESYLGGGKYDTGTFVESGREKLRVPCP